MTKHADKADIVLTPAQLAARWHMKEGTLSNWRREGKGPAFVKLGLGPRARVVYRLADIEAYEAQHRNG